MYCHINVKILNKNCKIIKLSSLSDTRSCMLLNTFYQNIYNMLQQFGQGRNRKQCTKRHHQTYQNITKNNKQKNTPPILPVSCMHGYLCPTKMKPKHSG